VTPPTRLTDWPVTIALVKDPDGYQIEPMETHSE
jgi:lactoylglutathione lyase